MTDYTVVADWFPMSNITRVPIAAGTIFHVEFEDVKLCMGARPGVCSGTLQECTAQLHFICRDAGDANGRVMVQRIVANGG